MLAERVKTWTEEWKQQGLEEGLEKGLQQGLEQGVHRSEARLLRRLLIRRFGVLPAWAEARLEQAGEGEIEIWADRVLDSTSLEEVLKDPT